MSSMGAPRDAARVRASRDSLSRRLGVGAGFAIVYCKFCNRTIERPPRLLRACRVMAGLVWGFLSSWNFAFFRPPRCLAWGWREGRLPALRFLGSATCRWLDPCQGRSRRRRGPKASLYKGPAIDDHRRPRSPGRVHVARSASLADETAVLHS